MEEGVGFAAAAVEKHWLLGQSDHVLDVAQTTL